MDFGEMLSPPDKQIPDAENHELNELTFGSGDDGRTHGTLDVDGLLGESWRQHWSGPARSRRRPHKWWPVIR